MRICFILLVLIGKFITIKNAHAYDSFSFMQKGLPCGFVHTTNFNYIVDGARRYDTVTNRGGFAIIAGEYIVTNYHVAIKKPQGVERFLFHRNILMLKDVVITKETRQLDFCGGVLMEITDTAQEIMSDMDIDYAVYRLKNRETRSRSLQVPIWTEYSASNKLMMAGDPGSMNVRTSHRLGHITNLGNQSSIRIETSIMFNDGDSGHPVFVPHSNILYAIGIGVEYKIATHRGRIIPLLLIAQDVKHKTKIDLLLLHKNFLENGQ